MIRCTDLGVQNRYCKMVADECRCRCSCISRLCTGDARPRSQLSQSRQSAYCTSRHIGITHSATTSQHFCTHGMCAAATRKAPATCLSTTRSLVLLLASPLARSPTARSLALSLVRPPCSLTTRPPLARSHARRLIMVARPPISRCSLA